MPDNEYGYDTAEIRKLLMAAFTPEELRRFCQDRPLFQPIVNRFGPGHGLDDMVDEAITYCEKWLLFDQLLDEVRGYNPAQYEKHGPYRYKAGKEGLPPATPAGRCIVFDDSYGQSGWKKVSPTPQAGYQDIAKAASARARVETNKGGYASTTALDRCQVLVLPAPYETLVDPEEYRTIADWVYSGKGLLVLGFYFMELHHHFNLNILAHLLGFEFCQDLIMPTGRESAEDCHRQAFEYAKQEYWILDRPDGTPADHPILQEISSLALTSSCTVKAEGSPAELTVVTREPVPIMQAEGYKDDSGRILWIVNYPPPRRGQAPFMVALRHGKGRIVGIGSWKIFLNELTAPPHDNMRLFLNIIDWLGAA